MSDLTVKPTHWEPAVIALGANLGDTRAALHAAVEDLSNHPEIRVDAVSDLARTKPVGGPTGQPDFLNQVLTVHTTLAPMELLATAQELETAAHRVRDVRWGPRTLDVDIITYGNINSEDPVLTLPHPRAKQRAFVLLPWSWADPEATLEGDSVAELGKRADDASGIHRLNGDSHAN